MPGIVRFAPSPTGFLHQGHLLSALYVWAAANKWNLKIHLRIENHDLGRARQEYIDSIFEDLNWLGFKYDFKSIQSERTLIYEGVLNQLKKYNLVYPCTCSRKQLINENPKSNTGEVIYQRKCLKLFEKNLLNFNTLEPHSLRVKIPNQIVNWSDYRLKNFSENPAEQCGDFTIRDRDNFWTYQFAVCIDDLLQGITHIVRGEDILNSTARQIAFSEILSKTCSEFFEELHLKIPPYKRPLYLHHPLIKDSTGKKLSKREHAHSLRQDKENGKTPEELFGEVIFKMGLSNSPAGLSLNDALGKIASTL